VTEYSMDAATGALTKLRSFPTGTGTLNTIPGWIAFDLSGAHAYVSNMGDHTISQFTVDANTGALSRNGADVDSAQNLTQIAVDPSGKYVYALNWKSISQYSVSKTGTLTPNGSIQLGPGLLTGAIAFAQR
jgi:6-phosphogluconolactonase